MKRIDKPWKPILIILAIGAALTGGLLYLRHSPEKVPVLSNALNLDEDKPKAPEEIKIDFKNYGPAPELVGINKWLNTENNAPIKLADHKGKIVLIDFWTYSSINSMRTVPYVNKWIQDYKDKGFEVVSIHTPEFAFEKVQANLDNFIKTHNIQYPIAIDNDYKTWTAYHNQFWPAFYLTDKDGNIVYTQFGEGNYEITEKAIRTLLGLEGEYTPPPEAETNQAKTPELYLGLAKLGSNLGNTEKPNTFEQIYTFPKKLANDKFAIEGRWQFNQEAAIHTKGYARVKLNFDAAKVFVVAEAKTPVTMKVYVDGELIKGVVVSNSDLYQVYDSLVGGKHSMEIEIPEGGIQLVTFTFG